jgi:hypothetical protein
MRWFFFFLSLLALFVANNALFWVPGHYDWFTFMAAGISISLALIFAWLSSRKFVAASPVAQSTWRHSLKSPPLAICLFVLLLFLAAGMMRIVAYAGR